MQYPIAARPLGAVFLIAAVIAASAPDPAGAQTRWVADDTMSRAVLPPPSGNGTVASAAIVCTEQRFSLVLSLEGVLAAEEEASLSIDQRSFATTAVPTAEGLGFGIPTEAIEPLKGGRRMVLSGGGELGRQLGSQDFSLAGSRMALTAMEETCSRPDMSAYQAVTFTPYSSYMGLARRLREEDISSFRRSTASEPELAVAMAEFGGSRRMLFTRLCGSSWYYGVSGCNVTGFSPDDLGEWRVAYDSEGVLLHLDWNEQQDGRPNLVTLPLRGQGEPMRWRWDGRRYAILTH